jgi:ADP-ribose pyrophosphatase YjhB (NUDIX family)
MIEFGVEKIRKVTLCFLIKENKILLAMKKRGFGKNKWNGYGGKNQENEKIRKTAKRETLEEIKVKITKMEKMAVLIFKFINKPEWNQKCFVYKASEWNGKPKESEEMKPKWFNFEKIPYEKMWADDKIWLPKILENKKVRGKFWFDEKSELVKHRIRVK